MVSQTVKGVLQSEGGSWWGSGVASLGGKTNVKIKKKIIKKYFLCSAAFQLLIQMEGN
jgi:hypothetical protein